MTIRSERFCGDLDVVLLACSKGNTQAQKQVYNDFYRYAYAIARQYGGNEEETEEIVQDAFLKLFRALAQSSPPDSFKPWFRRIIVNTGIDHYRKNERSRRVYPEQLSVSEVVMNLGEQNLDVADVHLFLRVLPPKYRLVFILHDVEGYTHKDIARRLGISEGTSKSNLARARKKLSGLVHAYFSIPKSKDQDERA